MWIKSKEKLAGFAIVFLIIILLASQFLTEYEEDKLLRNSKTTFGYIKKIYHGAPKSPKHGDFKYNVGGKEYEFDQPGNYEALKIGDTVLIEYAIADHSVARVVDKYYMKKYAYLKKIEK
ncbi:MAG: hypothetical protein QE487_01805 [Fluviicola sp.]|nr:hypothetical protein [Fluviicola sp.]